MIEHDNTTRRMSPFGFRVGEMATAAFLSLAVVLAFMALSEPTRHWCVVPLLACGTLIGCDAVGWLRGRLDVFDPVGLLGLLGTHVLFLAPLLHIYLDVWMRYVDPPPDWRDWLGWMAVVNATGLVLYRFAGSLLKRPRPSRTIWTLRSPRFIHLLAAGLLATGCLQTWVYFRYGGFGGYIDAYTSRSGEFSGQGWVFMLSESFPLLVTFLYVVVARRVPSASSWRAFLLFLLFLFACKIIFGGLRGSRSNTVWGLFWAVGVFHFCVRPVPRRLIFGGVVFLAAFMYVYGFFKSAGSDAVQAFEGAEARADLEARTGRSLEVILLGDLGRADVQAFVLYRLSHPTSDYEFALGRTYVSTLSLFIPRLVWPDPPPRKVKEGTDALRGRGAFAGGELASNVYGLAGEAMLNFGPWAVPLAFAALGLAVGAIRRMAWQWHPTDVRLMLYPLAINLSFLLLVSDSDNVAFFLLKNGLVPVCVVYLGTSQRPWVQPGPSLPGRPDGPLT